VPGCCLQGPTRGLEEMFLILVRMQTAKSPKLPLAVASLAQRKAPRSCPCAPRLRCADHLTLLQVLLRSPAQSNHQMTNLPAYAVLHISWPCIIAQKTRGKSRCIVQGGVLGASMLGGQHENSAMSWNVWRSTGLRSPV
jgi:hypothetical protein